jgi:hypothetical protein
VDADYAQETAALSRTLILQKVGTAMVAQANQRPQSVLAAGLSTLGSGVCQGLHVRMEAFLRSALRPVCPGVQRRY